MTTTIAAVIATYNYGRYIAEALNSVIDQTHRCDEIIVVDDGSTDETRAVVAGFGKAVTYLRIPHRGAAAARNAGWRAATASTIAFLDADDLWLPAKIAAQIALLAGVPAAGLVYSDTLRVRRDSGQQLDLWSDHMPPQSGRVLRPLLEHNFIQTSTVLMPRHVLEATGGFDERYTAWEDIHLWSRVAVDFPIAYIPRVLAHYRMGDGLSTQAVAMASGKVNSLREILPVAVRTEKNLPPAWARRLKGRSEMELGTAYYLEGQTRLARNWLFRGASTDRSLLREPLFLATWLKTYIPSGLARRLRDLRHRRS